MEILRHTVSALFAISMVSLTIYGIAYEIKLRRHGRKKKRQAPERA